MPLDQIANFVRGQLDADVDSTQTTFSVVDASVFPDPANGEYNLVTWDAPNHARPDQDPDVEIVRVTGRDTTNNDLTVTRGQEATVGAAHPSGSALQLSPTAALFGDVAATDTPVEDFPTNSTANGEVLTAQGDGTTKFAAPTSTPNWVEDANSPLTIDNATSGTITLAKQYDSVKVITTSGATNTFLAIRMNGDTGLNYDKIDLDGTLTTGDSEIRSAIIPAIPGHELNFSGKWSEACVVRIDGARVSTSAAEVGENGSIASPLESITFFSPSGINVDLTAKVYGMEG